MISPITESVIVTSSGSSTLFTTLSISNVFPSAILLSCFLSRKVFTIRLAQTIIAIIAKTIKIFKIIFILF